MKDKMYKNMMIGTGIVAAALLAVVLIVGFKHIEEPVFMTHYMDSYIRNDSAGFELRYFTNAGDDVEVTWIEFPDFTFYNVYHSVEEGKLYDIHTLRVEDKLTEKEVEWLLEIETYELRQGTVNMSDGKSQYVDFGKILLENFAENEIDVNTSGSSGSSDGSCSAFHGLNNSVTITGFTTNLSEEITDDLMVDLVIDGEIYSQGKVLKDVEFPVVANRRIEIIVPQENLLEKGIVYDLHLELYCQLENGTQGVLTFQLDNRGGYLDDGMITGIIREKNHE